jgi:hypothetical protein
MPAMVGRSRGPRVSGAASRTRRRRHVPAHLDEEARFVDRGGRRDHRGTLRPGNPYRAPVLLYRAAVAQREVDACLFAQLSAPTGLVSVVVCGFVRTCKPAESSSCGTPSTLPVAIPAFASGCFAAASNMAAMVCANARPTSPHRNHPQTWTSKSERRAITSAYVLASVRSLVRSTRARSLGPPPHQSPPQAAPPIRLPSLPCATAATSRLRSAR